MRCIVYSNLLHKCRSNQHIRLQQGDDDIYMISGEQRIADYYNLVPAANRAQYRGPRKLRPTYWQGKNPFFI